MKQPNRKTERLLLLAVSGIIAFMFYNYYSNIKQELTNVNTSYDNHTTIQLQKGFDKAKLKQILHHGEYFMDNVYEQFLVDELSNKMNHTPRIANLGALNKKPFLVEAMKMKKNGGNWGEARYQASAIKLGLDDAFLAKRDSLLQHAGTVKQISNNSSGISISGSVKEYIKDAGRLDKLFGKDKKPVANVLVRLMEDISMLKRDTLRNRFLADSANTQEVLFKVDLDTIGNYLTNTYYARTDTNGYFAFTNLKKGKCYSVIPIAEGKEYGVLRGRANIEESATIDFIQKTHQLPLFDRYHFKRIKSDQLFTVRSPQEFIKNMRATFLLFLLGFWLFHIALSIKGKHYDQYVLPLLMLIIGIGLVVLYAIQNPLTDMDYVTDTAMLLSGLLVVFSGLVFVFNEKWASYIANIRIGNLWGIKPIARRQGWLAKEPRGYEWLILSFILMIALLLFGEGPEGSGVKVNLFGIQVSELSKFLILLFFAKYFTANFRYFRNIPSNRWLIKHSAFMLIGLGSLIGIYAVLGDLGPALVLSFTFLIIYAFAKGEFPQMIGAAILFVLSLYAISFITGGASLLLSIYAGVVLLTLAIYAIKTKRNESLFFIVVVISSFVVLENFTFIPQLKRLADRNSMFQDPWDNSLHGGDQVAQGIWSIDSGGLFGQGLGNGLSNVMPAYHTDMIFASIGEELGIITLLVLLSVFGLLFFRSMLIARRTGHSFFFFLINGIAIATLVQLAIIIGGSLGLMPLTGISVPFLSKGNVSLLLNAFAFLSIILLSQLKGKSKQMEHIKKHFDDMNISVLFTFVGVILLFAGTLFYYWWFNERDMIRPVKVLSKQGEWMQYYNPRIDIIKQELKAGNIYDRNGFLLATSDRKTFLDLETKLDSCDIDKSTFQKQKAGKPKRYYPYGEDLIYYLGDRNTGLVTNQNLGLVAEYRFADILYGIKSSIVRIKDTTSNEFREASYLPKEPKETVLRTYDYSAYIPYLKAGKNSNKIEEFNKENRDVTLSLDVKMNQMINKIIRDKTFIIEARSRKPANYKVSVVALDVETGEVLASAINPKPNKKDILKLNQIPSKYYSKLARVYFGYENMVADKDFGMFHRSVPGSTIKVIDALAYLSRDGADSAKVSYYVGGLEEIIDRKVDNNGKPYEAIEPSNKNVDMKLAIVKSSNVYFIRLLNEKEFHPELFKLHQSVGINLFNKGGYYLEPDKNYNEKKITQEWITGVMQNKGLNYNNPEFKGNRKRYLQSHYSFMAWGQEPVKATPLQMARLYGAIAMDGELQSLNFVKVLGEKQQFNDDKKHLIEDNNKVNSKEVANTIEIAMKEQSKKRTKATNVLHYGKTGSPERVQYKYDTKKKIIIKKDKYGKPLRVTDAWYVCYIKDTKTGRPIAFATRIEGIGNSYYAVQLWQKIANGIKTIYFKEQSKNKK